MKKFTECGWNNSTKFKYVGSQEEDYAFPEDEVLVLKEDDRTDRCAFKTLSGDATCNDGSNWHWLYLDDVEPITKVVPKEQDVVNKPSHYTSGNIECINAIQAALTPEEFKGFCKGNVLKYNWRCNHKNGLEDLKKSRWYLDKLIETIEKEKEFE